MEDLGVDSLMMLEIVMLVEETLDVSIENDELMELRTLGDVKTLIDCKVQGIALPQRPVRMDLEEIAATVPYGRPFLFLDEAVLSDGVAQGSYRIDGGEAILEGHFKDNPIFPASIMIEALGQLAVPLSDRELERSGVAGGGTRQDPLCSLQRGAVPRASAGRVTSSI